MTEKRGLGKVEIGEVVSNKMTKTVVVKVERRVEHPVYKKYVRRTGKYMAHDEKECQVGDVVKIVECRPMSRHKRWVVREIMQRVEA